MTNPTPSAFYVSGSNPTEMLTNAMIARVTYSYARGDALAPLLQTCAVEALNDLQVPRGWVDSHKLADAIYNERAFQRKYRTKIDLKSATMISPSAVLTTVTCDKEQTRDYVQHCLREMFHGCRYNTEHCYQVHLDPECSPTCRARRDTFLNKLRAYLKRSICPTCSITLPLTNQCDFCGYEIPGQTP